MAHPQDTRDQIRRDYIFSQLSLEIAAARAGIPSSTARRWKNEAADTGDNWDKMRTAQIIAGGGLEDVSRAILAGLIIQYHVTLEQLNEDTKIQSADRVKLLSSLSDAYTKAVGASKKILPETNQLAVALDVLQRLAIYIKNNHPDQLDAFELLLEPFGREVAKAYG